MITLSDQIVEKAERLLLERRVHVPLPTTGVVARVEGDTGVYTIRRDGTGYSCSCPALKVCSHLLALSYVGNDGRAFPLPEGVAS